MKAKSGQLSSVVRDVFSYLFTRAGTAIISLCFTLLIANWLTSANYGRAMQAMALCQLGMLVGNLGLNQGMLLFGKETSGPDLQGVVAAAHLIPGLFLLLLCAMMGAAWGPVSHYYMGEEPSREMFLPCAGAMISGTYLELTVTRLRFDFRLRLFAIVSVVNALCYVVFSLLLLAKLGAAALPLGLCLSNTLVVVGTWCIIGHPFRGNLSSVPYRALFAKSLPLWLSCLMAPLLPMMSRTLVATNLGMTAVAVYSLSGTLMSPVRLVGGSLMGAWGPHALSHHERDDFAVSLAKLVLTLTGAGVVLALLAPSLLAMILPFLIHKPALWLATGLCGIQMWSSGVVMAASVLATVYIYRGLTYYVIWTDLATLILGVLAAYLLAIEARLDLLGIVLGEAVGASVCAWLAWHVSRRYVALPLSGAALAIWLFAGFLLSLAPCVIKTPWICLLVGVFGSILLAAVARRLYVSASRA